MIFARSATGNNACAARGSHTLINGAVSVRPYTCVMVHPSSSSMRSIVCAAGGAPAVRTRTPRGALARNASGALAIMINTVGAAQSIVVRSAFMRWYTVGASTLRTQMCAAPAAVAIHTNVHPLA